MTATLSEKRREKRVEIELPVSLGDAKGVTRDMSSSGAFFWISGKYAVGDPVGFAIELKTAGGKMMWKCQGDVVRTEIRNDVVGVAVKINESTMESV